MKTGVAELPLHPGKCPPWLFARMKKLAGILAEIIIYEYSREEFLKRLSDPFWFQSFACVLGFDWHSSGVTTTVCGALKETLSGDVGIVVAGGKGAVSRKAPLEIAQKASALSLSDAKIQHLIYASKMSAKIDSACVQDNYQLYHHVIIFTEKGKWAVIQQGLNNTNGYARRYHWLHENISSFINEPHNAICCDAKHKSILNMASQQSKGARKASVDVVADNEIKRLSMPAHHEIRKISQRTLNTLEKAYELQPQNYEELVSLKGIGPAAVRALALISELVYSKEPDWSDPVKFSFSHGGKDGIPYPVDKQLYDSSIEMLANALYQAKLGEKEKMQAIRRLSEFVKV